MQQYGESIPESVFGFHLIEKILQALDSDGIHYCVLRNSDSILGSFPAGDVDILVAKGILNLRRIYNKITSLQRTFGFSIYAKGSHANVRKNLYLSTIVNDKLYTINLEFFNEIFVYEYKYFKSKKYNYLDTKSILRDRIKNGVIYAASAENELVHKVVDAIFNKKSQHFEWLKVQIDNNLENKEFRQIAEEAIGKSATNKMINTSWLSEHNELIDDLEITIFRHIKKYKKFPFISDFIRDFWSIFQHAKQYVSPGGMFCFIAGTDGSGKTAVSDGISRDRARSFNKVHRVHLGNRPISLPSYAGKRIDHPSNQLDHESSVNFHEYKLNNKRINIYQLCRFIYITFDYILHYYLVIRPLISRGDMFLTERYFTDYVIVPERYFPFVPKWLKNLCYVFIPKPDVIIHLSVDIDLVSIRKKELPYHLIEYEISRFHKFVKQNKCWQVSNSGELNEAIETVEKIIFSDKKRNIHTQRADAS